MTEQEYNELDKILREQAGTLPVKSFDEKMEEIHDRMYPNGKTPTSGKVVRPKRLTTIVVALAASFVLLFGIGTAVYFGVNWERNQGKPPIYSYEDKDINIIEENGDQLAYLGIYKPDFDVLTEKCFAIGEQRESKERIYYFISGNYTSEIVSKVELRIIFHSAYHPDNEAEYNKKPSVEIGGKEIFCCEANVQDSVYLYKLGFTDKNFRYYIDYLTTEKDGHLAFLEAFIC